MALLTDAQKATLLQLLADNGLTGVEEHAAANTLNAPTTVTVPGITRPKPIAWADVLDCLTADQVRSIVMLPAVTTIIDQVNAQDRDALVNWVGTLLKGQFITATEVNKLQALLASTETLPGSTVQGPSPFEAAFPGFYHEVDGVGYERCTAALILEARA